MATLRKRRRRRRRPLIWTTGPRRTRRSRAALPPSCSPSASSTPTGRPTSARCLATETSSNSIVSVPPPAGPLTPLPSRVCSNLSPPPRSTFHGGHRLGHGAEEAVLQRAGSGGQGVFGVLTQPRDGRCKQPVMFVLCACVAQAYEKHESMLQPQKKKATVALKECIELFTTMETLGEHDPW